MFTIVEIEGEISNNSSKLCIREVIIKGAVWKNKPAADLAGLLGYDQVLCQKSAYIRLFCVNRTKRISQAF